MCGVSVLIYYFFSWIAIQFDFSDVVDVVEDCDDDGVDGVYFNWGWSLYCTTLAWLLLSSEWFYACIRLLFWVYSCLPIYVACLGC
jgi:hypothetical protein